MDKLELIIAAEDFIRSCYSELNKTADEIEERMIHINASIDETGTYEHTYDELNYGAKMAWRNSNRCIGRLFWERLQVVDKRNLHAADDIAQALFEHIEWATNGGRIRPRITIFKQEQNGQSIRIWNHQLLRYAGYKVDNEMIGDPASYEFTSICSSLGWKGEGGCYDILPLVLDNGNGSPVWYEMPKELVMEVPITHSTYGDIDRLGMKWYAVPIISDMKLVIGGISYCAAPFNGWYMGTEIGARNLVDEERYNMLPQVAKAIGLATDHASSLWKDRALVELNVAVLESYKAHGVTIVDHHTAASQFERFCEHEASEGRELTGRWSWLIPPLSPAATPIYHSSYNDKQLWPNFEYQRSPYCSITLTKSQGCPFHN